MSPSLMNKPTLDTVAAAMLKVLSSYLPAPAPPLPAPNVAVVSMGGLPAGLGYHRGSATTGAFAVVDLKAVRLDAVARFQLWASAPTQADDALAALNAKLMADRDPLWAQGFLRLTLENTSSADPVPVINAWRKSADYRILYEFPYQDSDDAESLIAEIPANIDTILNETMIITDEATRWDNLAAPPLLVRGRFGVGSLSALTFVPGPTPTGTVTLTRSFDGAPGAPTPYATLAAFLAAVAGPNAPDRHARFTFVSLNAFLTAFAAAGEPVTMGDWDADGVPDKYNPLALAVDPPIELPRTADRFEVAYQIPPFDKVGVVYIRAMRGPMD